VNKVKIIGWGIGSIVVVAALIVGYFWLALSWSYSKGDRAGYVQKFSQKGWVIKTWEGELQMTPVPGTVPEKFLFSTRDDTVVKKINAGLGRKIVLQYEQHKGLPTGMFGETEYFVTDVRVIE